MTKGTETSHCGPEGSTPSRQRPASQPEASLAREWQHEVRSVGEQVLKLRDRAPKSPLSEAFVVPLSGGSIGVTAKARVHRFDRGPRAEQRHRMDHLDT